MNSNSGSGGVTIFGSGPNPGVNLKNYFSGNLLFCGFSLGNLEGGSGNVGIQNGSFGSIKNYNGNIVLLGSNTFPATITNFNGNLVIKNSTGQYFGRSYVNSK